MAAGIAIVIYLFFVASGATSLFRDSDTGWHIRTGERILRTGMLPHADPYSFYKPGAPWIAWEWAADALMGAAHTIGGLGGVAVLYGVAIGASVWMWFRVSWAAGGNYLLACLFAAPMISTTTLHWLARPHVFGWLFVLATVWFCERMPTPFTWVHVVGIAAFSALWANVHASFFFGPLIVLLYGAGGYVAPKIWNIRGGARGHLVAAIAAALATILNPNGWRLHQHVLTYLTDSALLDRVAEFQSFNFHAAGAGQVILALALCAAGAFAALAVKRLDRFLLSALFLVLALTSARAIPVAALALLPIANGSITEVLSLARGLKTSLRRSLDGALTYGDNLRRIDRGLRGFALVPLVAIAIFLPVRSRAAFPSNVFPVEAASSIPADARLFAPDLFGGYLIYHFDGALKVFFDGRSDFYGADFLNRYSRIVQLKPGWQNEFARWNFTHALLPSGHSLVSALEATGWTEVHRDKTAVLLQKGAAR